MTASNIICITGSVQRELNHVAAIFSAAGMTASMAASREQQLDLTLWHQKVVAETEQGAQLSQQILPGRLWEQLAGDVFLANMQVQLWGWADSRSIWLLDFWLNFEPNIKFVLVCVSPQQMLADLLAGSHGQSSGESAVEPAIRCWLEQHREMLRFHNRHPQRTLLVAADDCQANPDELLSLCQDNWQLPLTQPCSPFEPPPAPDGVYRFLAEQLCREFPELESLSNELAATITQCGDEELLTPPLEQIITQYQTMLADHAQALELANAEARAIEQQRDAVTQQSQKLDATLARLESEHAALQQAKTGADQARLKAEQQGQASEDKIKSVETTLSSAQEKIKSIEEKVKNTEENLRESNEENELLLLQLHQVQEELEHYFLRQQELQSQLTLADEKWQQLMRRYPDYIEYEALELISDEEDPLSPPRWRFKDLQVAGRSFAELEVWAQLERGIAGLVFARQSEPAGPLKRWPSVAAQQDELFIIPIAQEQNLQLRAEILLDLATSDWNLIKALAKAMEKELDTVGSSAQAHFTAHQPEQLAALRAGLVQFATIIDGYPAKFRYDTLALKQEQVNPGYEHLWLRCENVAFGAKTWPVFEFRLACANVTPKRFGKDPKLEFPQASGAAPLSGWFAESEDQFGEKLELRFALPDAMDIGVWQQLPKDDQLLITSLMQRLPAMLKTLSSTDIHLQRSWDDWIVMSQQMTGIFAERTASPPVAASLAAPVPALAASAPATSQAALRYTLLDSIAEDELEP